MRSMSWMRIAGGFWPGGAGRWPPRAAPPPCRGPPTPSHIPTVSDTTAGAETACRAARAKRQPSAKELHEERPESKPDEGTAASSGEPPAGPAAASVQLASPVPRSLRTVARRTASKSKTPDPSTPSSEAPAQQVQPQPSPQSQTGNAVPALGPAPATTTRPRRPRTKPSTAPEPQPDVHASVAAGGAPAPAAQPLPSPTVAVRRTAPAGVLLVVDGNYLANRSYFGYAARRLSTSGGVPTSITYGVIKTLQAAIRAVHPTALAVVFDPPGPTFRTAMSLLDPSGPAGRAAAQLVMEGRLDWQALATRLLGLAAVQADLSAAAASEAAAMPASFLHPKGTFLPAPEAAIINWQLQPSVPPSVVNSTTPAPEPSPSSSRAAAAREVLVAALGPELAATLGLVGDTATAAALVPLYKAGRTSRGEDFHSDFRNLQRLLGLMSVPPLCRPWLEADDLAGLFVQQAVQHGMAVRIVSGDRDLMQLVSDRDDVTLLYPAPAAARGAAAPAGGGGGRRSTRDFPFNELREADVVLALGVAPALVADYKALTGDDSDSLPGVSGIGSKTAAQLLAAYGSLAGIHRAVDELPAKRRAALQAALPASLYTLALARVLGSPGAPAVPADVLPDGLLQRLCLRGFDPVLVEPALLELEMRSLARGVGAGGELWRDFGGGR